MALDLNQLLTFQSVVHEGSFESAARVLHVTPAAVSQRIKALEEAVGRSQHAGADRAAGREAGVREQERRAAPPDHGQRHRLARHDRAESGDPGDDQHGVRDGAGDDDGPDVLAAQSLAQHERVLGSDGDDEREAESESGEQGEHVPHAKQPGA